MTFLWPKLLWLLVLIPVITATYIVLVRRKRKASVRYASLGMMREALAGSGRFRRHVPPLLFLVAIALMLTAIARPAAVVTVPSRHDTIVLAMDVSGSMRAVDVQPSRIAAAQAAAREFVKDVPSTTRVGVVAFAATATVVQPPTNHREDVVAAIDRFQLQRGTAVGSGILVSLKTIFPDVQFDLRAWNPRGDNARKAPKGQSLDKARPPDDPAPDKDAATKAAPGSYGAAAIIVLTDGQTTTGPDPIESARMASERGVKVFTVGVGTQKGETIHSEGWSMRVRLDEDALKNIANITRGEYFYAGSAPDLKKIYQSLNAKLVFEKKEMEITAFFAGAAALFALLSALLSMMWFNRIL